MNRKKLLCVFLTLLLMSVFPFALAVSEEGGTELIGETVAPEIVFEPETGSGSDFTPEPSEPEETPSEEPDAPTPTEPEETPSQPPETPPEPAEPGEQPGMDELFPPVTEDPEPSDGPTDPEPSGGPADPETPSGDGEALPEDEAPEPDEEPASEPEELPYIHVTVPDTGRVIVNPYGLRVSLEQIGATDQIVCAPMPIVNYSEVAVSVSAGAVGSAAPGSEVEFVQTPPSAADVEKEVFLYLEFQRSPDGSSRVAWEDWFYDAPNQLLVTGQETYKDDLLTLGAGGMEPVYGVFRLFGSTSASYENMWTAEDTVDVSIAFTFRALSPEPTEPDGQAAGPEA